MRQAASLALLVCLLPSCVSTKPPEGDTPSRATTVTVPGEDIVVIGDQGTGSQEQYAVAKAVAAFCKVKRCDFGITVGDNFYPAGVKSVTDKLWQTNFEVPYKDLGFRFYASLGNHDYMGSWQAQIAYSTARWSMPYRYYKLSSRYADLWAIDTNHIDASQLAWLEAGLAASKAKWKVVYGHHPLYSSGSHGGNSTMQKALGPLLKKYRVNAAIFGHDHHLELISKENGTLAHVVSGAAGKLRSVKAGKDTVFARGELGFVHMDFAEDNLELSFIGTDSKTLYAVTYNERP